MTWCLWGQARTGSRNYDALIAYGETECRVELDFQAQGQTYRVIRRRLRSGRGRTELDLFTLNDAGQPRPITGNSVRDTDARIRRLVGMDYDTFVNSAFLLQGRSDEFTRKTPPSARTSSPQSWASASTTPSSPPRAVCGTSGRTPLPAPTAR